jgi:hypothetical protein
MTNAQRVHITDGVLFQAVLISLHIEASLYPAGAGSSMRRVMFSGDAVELFRAETPLHAASTPAV